MKIAGQPVIRNNASIRRRRDSVGDAGDFQSLFASEISEPETSPPVTGGAPVGSLDMMLALQEIPEELHQKKQTLARGQQAIEALEKLRQSLLMGSMPPETLSQLQKTLSERQGYLVDPKLASIMEEIELRVAVELAKLEAATRP